jgi:hypothetical protein
MTLLLILLAARWRAGRDAGHLRAGLVPGILAHPRRASFPRSNFSRRRSKPSSVLKPSAARSRSPGEALGLALIGCLTMAATVQGTPVTWEALAWRPAGGLLCHPRNLHHAANRLPQEHRAFAAAAGSAVPRAGAGGAPLVWALEFLQSLFELATRRNRKKPRPEEHIEALIAAGEEEGIIEKGDRELIQSVVAFGDKTVREVMTPRPRIVAIRQMPRSRNCASW